MTNSALRPARLGEYIELNKFYDNMIGSWFAFLRAGKKFERLLEVTVHIISF